VDIYISVKGIVNSGGSTFQNKVSSSAEIHLGRKGEGGVIQMGYLCNSYVKIKYHLQTFI
jgi:hypothetical protein